MRTCAHPHLSLRPSSAHASCPSAQSPMLFTQKLLPSPPTCTPTTHVHPLSHLHPHCHPHPSPTRSPMHLQALEFVVDIQSMAAQYHRQLNRSQGDNKKRGDDKKRPPSRQSSFFSRQGSTQGTSLGQVSDFNFAPSAGRGDAGSHGQQRQSLDSRLPLLQSDAGSAHPRGLSRCAERLSMHARVCVRVHEGVCGCAHVLASAHGYMIERASTFTLCHGQQKAEQQALTQCVY